MNSSGFPISCKRGPYGTPDLKNLPVELKKKCQGLLEVYGGLEGLASRPPWLVNAVLKALFTEAERVQILIYLFRNLRPERRGRLLKDLGVR